MRRSRQGSDTECTRLSHTLRGHRFSLALPTQLTCCQQYHPASRPPPLAPPRGENGKICRGPIRTRHCINTVYTALVTSGLGRIVDTCCCCCCCWIVYLCCPTTTTTGQGGQGAMTTDGEMYDWKICLHFPCVLPTGSSVMKIQPLR